MFTDTQLSKWGERYGIGDRVEEIKQLRRKINIYAKQREHYCNGDPHGLNPVPSDKSRNAEFWDQSSDITGNAIKYLAKKLGFDGIDFGVGLYPVLMKGNDSCIHIPE